MNIQALTRALSAVCPIHGVSVGRGDDRATWRIDFKDEATTGQRAAARSVIDAFDPATPEPPSRDVFGELDDAKATIVALVKKGAITRSEIDAEKSKP